MTFDTECAVNFLLEFDPTGWHNLVAIDPDSRAIHGRTFPPGSTDVMFDWINERNGKANLYFSVNEPKPGAPQAKLSKADIGAVRAVYTDIDPTGDDLASERDRMKRLAAGSDSTLSIDSGGGVQLFWKLSDKVPTAEGFEWAEGCNRRVAADLGGDHTWDVNRIMRLPYTVNLPDAKKRARGRTPALATVLRSSESTWSRAALEHAFPPKPIEQSATDNDEEVKAAIAAIQASDFQSYSDFDDLPPTLRRKMNTALADQNRRDLWHGDGAGNEHRFALAGILKSLAFRVQEYACLARIWHRSTSKPERPSARDLARDWVRSRPQVSAADEFGVLGGNAPARLPTIRVSDFAKSEKPERKWLVEDQIPDRNVTILNGDGAVGKSLLALQLGIAVATGSRWLGLPVQPGPCLYFSAEDEQDENHIRSVDIAAGARIPLEKIDDCHIAIMAGEDALLAIEQGQGSTLKRTPLFARLRAELEAVRPKLLVLDNLADIFGGNENVKTTARQFMTMLRGLAIEFDCAVLLLAHPSMSGMASGTGSSGNVAWNNSARSRLYLQREKDGDGEEPDPNKRFLEGKKANYAPTGLRLEMRWENGRFVALDMPELDGVEGLEQAETKEAKAQRVFLELVQQYNKEGRNVSTARAANYAPVIFSKHHRAQGVSKPRFERAMNELLETGRIAIETVGPPSRPQQNIRFVEDVQA